VTTRGANGRFEKRSIEVTSSLGQYLGSERMAFLRNLVIYLLKRLVHKCAEAVTRRGVCPPAKSLEVLSGST